MKIQQKLLLGFGVGLLATLGVGGDAIYSIRTLNDHVKRVYDNALMTSTFEF